MTDNVVPIRPREEPAPDCYFRDEDGVEWFAFALEYAYAGSRWALRIMARNWEDAEARAREMRPVVVGQLYAAIEAQGDVTTEAIVRAGGVMRDDDGHVIPAAASVEKD